MVFAFNVKWGLLRFELFLISFQQLIYFKPQITQRFYHPFLTIYKKNHYGKRKGKIKFGNGFALLLPLLAGPLLPRSNCIIHHTFISSGEKWGKNHFHHHPQNW